MFYFIKLKKLLYLYDIIFNDILIFIFNKYKLYIHDVIGLTIGPTTES